jgi:AAA domain-containing protein
MTKTSSAGLISEMHDAGLEWNEPAGTWKEIKPHPAPVTSIAPGKPIEMVRGASRGMKDILADPPERPFRPLEPALIIEGGLTVLAAPTKVGKINLWLHMAWALTEGASLWGRFEAARPIPVLMIQLELSEATMFGRFERPLRSATAERIVCLSG